MKTTINPYASLLVAFLLVTQVFYGQKKEKKEHNISYSTFNHKSEIERGIWFGTIERETVCLQLMDTSSKNNPSFMIGLCIPVNEFTLNATDGFELNKPSGTIKFQGTFPDEKGNGDFTFVKNPEFETFLAKEGINTTGEDSYYYFKLFLGDVSKEYVLGLKKLGYRPTLKQLGKLGIHDVDLAYVNSIAETNYKGMEINMLLKFAIHGISIDYIKSLEKAGYGRMDANMVKKFAIHDVRIDYINGLTDLGYKNMDPNMIKNFAVHNITLDYIQGLSQVGFADLEPNMLKKFAIHDIRPNYINSIRLTGVEDIDANTIKKAKIHGLTANYIKRSRAKGSESKTLSEFIKLKIHGK